MPAPTDAYAALAGVLKSCKSVLITTHVRPDGDALGTTAAVHLGLKQLGVSSECLLLSHLPAKYAFVYNDAHVLHYDFERGWPNAFDFDRFDALLVCDTGTWSQLPGLKDRVASFAKPKLVLDHHLTQEDWPTHHLVDKQAAAAAEVAHRLLFDHLGVTVTKDIATALYLGLCTDTGWFQFSNTSPHTMRLAARLMEAGVDTDRLYRLLYQNERKERIALHARAHASLELLHDGRLAVMTLGKQDFADTGAHVPDTENVVNFPLQIRTVEVALLFTDPPEGGPIRVSLRSKGQVDVAALAAQFGGGGHARAAGCKVEGSHALARERLSTALLASLPV
ncbi:MAG TPA: DHH family phosphoesterase [Tepidisphaeraceae bacterium]|nr:DHH family phosphoesterase [Tepidisphaeraceae bacterium]